MALHFITDILTQAALKVLKKTVRAKANSDGQGIEGKLPAVLSLLTIPCAAVIVILGVAMIHDRDPIPRTFGYVWLGAIAFPILAAIHMLTYKVTANADAIATHSRVIPDKRIDLHRPFQIQRHDNPEAFSIRQESVVIKVSSWVNGYADLLDLVTQLARSRNLSLPVDPEGESR